MSVRTLQCASPFYVMKAVKDERNFHIGPKSIIINFSDEDIFIKEMPLKNLHSAVLTNITLKYVACALLVEGFETRPAEEALRAAKAAWPLMSELSPAERYKGVPLRRSPKERVGNVVFNLFHVEPGADVGLHREHPYDEVHTQLAGCGKMQKYRKNDFGTLYFEEILAPGMTHESYRNAAGEYPWHQYQSMTESIYIYINQYDRNIEDEPAV